MTDKEVTNSIRMLSSTNVDDVAQLSDILEDYNKSEQEKLGQVYVASNLGLFSKWIFDKFKKSHYADFVIFGSFHNNELIQIMVAYKFDLAWGYDYALNNLPYWYVGLAYFKDRAWRNPGVELINLGLCLGAHFEKQGYYKFYTTKKMPNRIVNNDQLQQYINSPAFKKTYQVERYSVKVEKIFRTDDDRKKFRFAHWQSVLPRGISRPIMLLEFTLDPTIDINTLIKIE